MMYVAHGTVVAGFIDSNGWLFQRTIDEGDVFMFPRGLLHFCVNAGFGLATAYSVFNSQNPGVVSIAGSMFTPESEVVQRMVERMLRLKSDGNG
ncbi:Germin-like protein 11-1 [Ananas comosus]|uniref:Germin-like protein n=1 Tax=Ananas comosus TaxID=4615 RepID=A0A199UZW5_ANACO|nr:Germin-like protein 11-1 [Ananas comosus]